MIKKIAVTGKLRSGKDTVAEYISRELEAQGYRVYHLAFGNKIKDIASELFDNLDNEPKPRELYQAIGSLRQFDNDIWIKHLDSEAKLIEKNEHEKKALIITDLRFLNEATYCKQQGYTIIRVNTSDEVRKQRVLKNKEIWTEETSKDVSELEVDKIEVDIEISNNGTLEELVKKLANVMVQIENGTDVFTLKLKEIDDEQELLEVLALEVEEDLIDVNQKQLELSKLEPSIEQKEELLELNYSKMELIARLIKLEQKIYKLQLKKVELLEEQILELELE